MFEAMTYETILNSCLQNVSAELDTREGSIIRDALSPACLKLANFYVQLDAVLDETFADTCGLNAMIRKAKERGIEQYKATKSIVKLETTPTDIEIPIGNRFTCGTIAFVVTEKIDNGEYKCECETEGTDGNHNFGLAIPIDYVENLATAYITEVLIPARDDEELEDLRKRYFDSFGSQAYGGNVADYKQKTKSINGVGGVKVVPVWDGGGTVKLVLIDSEWHKPSTALVNEAQNIINPLAYDGLGVGVAPIDHKVTVVGVDNVSIDVEAEFTFEDGYTFESCETAINEAVESFLLSLAQNWENETNLVVRRTALSSALLNVEGVNDVQNMKLNNLDSNVSLDEYEIAVKGVVSNAD